MRSLFVVVECSYAEEKRKSTNLAVNTGELLHPNAAAQRATATETAIAQRTKDGTETIFPRIAGLERRRGIRCGTF